MDPALENLTDLARNNGYGHELLLKEFLLYDGLLNFNHGSFGTVPKVVMNRHVELLYEQESCPETWFRQTYFPYVNKSRKLVADLIHGCVEDVVLVENASTAVNAILRSFPFQSGDVVLVFSSAYRMVTETLLFQEFYQNVQTILVPIAYPVNGPEEMIHNFKTVIEEYGSRVKLCIFSHISSMPTIIEPIHELTKIAKSYGSLVLIDGAHAPGVLDIFVEVIGCDYYTGNCHKWLYCSKGSAFLWVAKSIYQSIPPNCTENMHPQPIVISSTGKHDFLGRFEYTGTRDYVAFCAMDAAFRFIDEKLSGMTKMREYCSLLLQEGCQYLVKEWRTGLLVPLSMNGFMANVILPTTSRALLLDVQQKLLQEHHITMVFEQVPARKEYSPALTAIKSTSPTIELFPGEGEGKIFFIRISSQVYLEFSDFVKLNRAVKTLLQLA